MFRPVLLLGFTTTVACAQVLHYPEAHPGDVVDTYFGTKVADPYRWLEDLDSSETLAWVNAERQITNSYLKDLPDREIFKEDLTKLLDFERFTPPSWEGHRYVYRANSGLQNQSVIYSAKTLSDPPTILLDPNKLSSDGTVAVTDLDLSNDGRLLAYGVAVSGSDWNEIRVKSADTGEALPDLVKWVKFSGPRWTKDSRGFFYGRFPEPDASVDQTFVKLQNQKIYYHRIGEAQEKDQLIYENPAESDLTYDLEFSHDGRYLFLTVNKGTDTRNKIYFKDLVDPFAPRIDAPFQPIEDQFEANFSFVNCVETKVYFRTDLGSPKNKIIEFDLENRAQTNWKTIIPETKDLLQSADLVGGKIVANYLVDAKSQLVIFNLEGKKESEIPLPTLGTVSAISGDPDRPELFYAFTSFLYPPTIYRYDIEKGKSELFKKPNVDLNTDAFETQQIFYRSKDGTQIPMFLVSRKDLKLDGNNPVYLTGYGGFNIPLTPYFSPSYLSWIQRGGIFALPSLRGGGEYGREWHEAGTKERKQNVFDDFIGAAESLIREKYSAPGKIAIVGASNGGLLMGAALTQRPELFGAVVPKVGVLDMLRFQKFTIGWAWSSDYGSSDTEEGFNYLIKYSPLQNIKKGTCYPPTLITTGDHDDRVFPGHSFKFAATLQAAQGCDNPILIRIESKAGHGAGKPTAKLIEEEADILAFLWDNVTKPKPIASSQKKAGSDLTPKVPSHKSL